jgi:hypothetical protein
LAVSPVLLFAGLGTYFTVDRFASHATALAAALALISVVLMLT